MYNRNDNNNSYSHICQKLLSRRDENICGLKFDITFLDNCLTQRYYVIVQYNMSNLNNCRCLELCTSMICTLQFSNRKKLFIRIFMYPILTHCNEHFSYTHFIRIRHLKIFYLFIISVQSKRKRLFIFPKSLLFFSMSLIALTVI